MKLLGVGIAIIAAGCMVNGKSLGPGGGGNTANGGGGSTTSSDRGGTAGTSGDLGDIGDRGDSGAGDKYWGARKYGGGPADPWMAVAGDQPKLIPHERADYWKLRGDDYDCTAAHDHCLEPYVWFTISETDRKRGLPKPVAQAVFGTEHERQDHLYGPVNGRADGYGGDPFVAYRTVPATTTNIAVGTLVIALDRSAGALRSAEGANGATWWIGEVEEIDLDGGFFKLKDRDDMFKLWGARPVVLMWKPGGKVQIVGGKSRDQLAVKAADTFKPE